MTDSQKKNAYNPKKHHRKSRRLKEYDYSKSGLYFITLLCEKRIHRFGQIKNGKMQLNECGQIAFDEWVKLPERFSKFKMNVFQIMPDHFHSIIELVGTKEPASLTAAQIGTCLGRWCKIDTSAMASPELFPIGKCVGKWCKNDSSAMASQELFPIGKCVGKWCKNDSSAMAGQELFPIGKCVKWFKNDSSASTKLAAKKQNKNIADIISAYKSLVFNACLNTYKAKNKKMGRLWHRNYYERIIRNKLAYTRISNYIINNPSKWTEKKG